VATIDILRDIDLPPREVEPIYRSLARAIRDRIRAGQLRPGDQLPTKRELALALNVSVHTVRHAYSVLVREMLLIGGQGERMTVAGAKHRLVAPPAPTSAAPSDPQNQLRGVVQAIESNGPEVEMVLEMAEGQRIRIATTRAAVEWLGLEPGRSATVSIQASDILLTRSVG
jgi:molybdopterin-binding protein